MDRYDDPDRVLTYSYASVNDSIVDKVYKYWWRLAFKLVPGRISANLLSMLGNIGSWAALAILIAFGASYGPGHPWIFALCAFLVFAYHTIDCLDGMQARRIGVSGPLGEFVDHWFDAMNVFFFPLSFVAAFPVVSPSLAAVLILVSGISDWVVLREVVKTGKLHFGAISSEEGITLHMLVLVSIPVLGYDFWASPIAGLGLAPIVVLLALVVAGHLASIIVTLMKIKFDGLGALCVQLASTAPLAVWTVAGQVAGQPRWIMTFGLLCIGFVGTRHVGDLLRVRLVGLRYPSLYADLAAGSAAALVASWLVATGRVTATWIYAAPMAYVAATTLAALCGQFYRTVALVRRRLGTGLFHVPERQSGLQDRGR
ncbi:MAG: CDP-alcohol phosphatidyltransferase family protein [Spirochaetes bacterium]|nr:CDP-alcohol phosphatidyltransferase family protein [Spirochaetota bacterium]MBU1079667.1 CDP-alcohol phosphatidyltransferase family protein [Spirochaetota bacterium]